MSPKEIQKRNVKAENLKVLQSEDGQFFVESEKARVLYRVVLGDDGNTCTCGDFSTGIRRDKNHQCKHILAVINAIPRKTVEDAQFCEKPVPKLDDRFMTNIKGKDFVLYAGVLDLATQKGLLKLEVELLQYPSKENGNEAICRAVAVGKSGQVFSDIGDANPSNCHSMIAKHLIRMASTRAKGRALPKDANINSLYNYPVQGTAADGFKLALIYLDKKLAGQDAHIVHILHDEVIVEARDDIADAVAVMVRSCMERAFNDIIPEVPFVVEPEVKDSWA